MNDTSDGFFVAVGYIATAVAILLIGLFIGYVEGSAKAKSHHESSYNERGELTCEICKELLEKGRK